MHWLKICLNYFCIVCTFTLDPIRFYGWPWGQTKPRGTFNPPLTNRTLMNPRWTYVMYSSPEFTHGFLLGVVAEQSLHSCWIVAVQLLNRRCTVAEQSLCSCWTVAVQLLNSRCAVAEQSLYSCLSVAVQLLNSRCTVAEQSLYSCWTVAAQLLNSRCTVAEQSLYSCWTVAVQLLNSRCTVA